MHSLKDLPVEDPDELCVGAVLGREEAREVLISRDGRSLASLPAGAVVGSSSTRRQAQLLTLRPDLVVRPIRGFCPGQQSDKPRLDALAPSGAKDTFAQSYLEPVWHRTSASSVEPRLAGVISGF